MELEQIKDELELYLEQIKDELEILLHMPKSQRINKGEYVVRILAKLKTIIGNPKKNPTMNFGEAEKYYVYGENALEHIQERYILIFSNCSFKTSVLIIVILLLLYLALIIS